MSNDDRVIALVREGNPIPDPNDMDRDHLDAAAYLEILEQRSSDMTQLDTTRKERESRSAARPRWLAAAVVTVLIGTAAFLISQTDDFGPDSALASSFDFIDAFNAGDVDALLGTLSPDVALSESYSPGTGDFEVVDPVFFEQHMVWATAQGSTLTTPECVLAEESATSTEVGVVCEFGWLYAPEKAGGLTPIPTVLTMVVTREGISEAAFEYPPRFGSNAFNGWVLENYPDDRQRIEYGAWNSVAEAEQYGLLRGQYAEEWSHYLEASQ